MADAGQVKLVGRVTPHLLLSEVACHDGTPYPKEWADRLRQLGVEFERIRAACLAVRIDVLSGYRTRTYNATVPGAAADSQHVFGRALDLATPEGMTPKTFARRIRGLRGLYPECQIRGLGVYAWGCHVDIRPGKALHEWEG